MNKQQLQQELAKVTREYEESHKLPKTKANFQISLELLNKKHTLELQLEGLS